MVCEYVASKGSVLNRRASSPLRPGKERSVRLKEVSGISGECEAGILFFCLREIESVSSRRRLSTIVSITLSILVITSALVGRGDGAMAVDSLGLKPEPFNLLHGHQAACSHCDTEDKKGG